jgi:hypothetical protein
MTIVIPEIYHDSPGTPSIGSSAAVFVVNVLAFAFGHGSVSSYDRDRRRCGPIGVPPTYNLPALDYVRSNLAALASGEIKL